MTGGKTMTVDTKTNQIYIIAAEYGPAPPPPAEPPPGGRSGRGGRGPMVADSFTILVVGK